MKKNLEILAFYEVMESEYIYIYFFGGIFCFKIFKYFIEMALSEYSLYKMNFFKKMS